MSKDKDKKKTTAEPDLFGPDILMIFPTDTVYGIGGNGNNKSVVNRIYRLKRRSRDKPLALHLFSVQQAWQYTSGLSPKQENLIKELLPGPYTLILPASTAPPPVSVSNKRKVGIRVPHNKTFTDLESKISYPLVGTSVNKSGEPPLTDFEKIVDRYGGLVELFIESDQPMENKPSTVLDLTYDPPKVLRGKYPRSQSG